MVSILGVKALQINISLTRQSAARAMGVLRILIRALDPTSLALAVEDIHNNSRFVALLAGLRNGVILRQRQMAALQ